MDTTATNKRVRELIGDIESRRLIPNPSFQRRLVWSQKHKAEFVRTVLEGLPFPEIYIAAGDVDIDTGKGYSMLVDGQQRMTTIFEYFKSSPNITLPADILPYDQLEDQNKRDFLEYKIVVRDLGNLTMPAVIDIFERINSTSYSLNAIEVANARYDNDLKDLAEEITQLPFWNDHSTFKLNEVKRMQDVNFALVLITTMISDYYNRDDRVEEFLIRYNDSFDNRDGVRHEVATAIGVVDDYSLPDGSRAWQRADLFTLLVETHRLLFKEKIQINTTTARKELDALYARVEDIKDRDNPQDKLAISQNSAAAAISDRDILSYYRSTLQASNDRKNRIERGRIVKKALQASA